MPFGVRLDPFQSSYYSNLTGFWKGGLQFYNLTSLPKGAANTSKPGWKTLADQFMANANMTNVTEVAERMGSWNWTASNKFTMSIRDKAILPLGTFTNISQDIAIIHVRSRFARVYDPPNGFCRGRLILLNLVPKRSLD